MIVDEAHTCASGNNKSTSQQQRHQLIQDIAAKLDRNLVLLTATPHSGIEEAFLSLLGLLKPEFRQLSLDSLNEEQRKTLAQHFIQRRRADVKLWLGDETPLPERESTEVAYKLLKEYKSLFEDVYNFARGLVKYATSEMSYAQRRGRYWSALALIRCVMSSPAAAITTLSKKRKVGGVGFRPVELCKKGIRESNIGEDSPVMDEDLMSSYVYDPADKE
ncbi:hypothetical protein NIES2101_27110 [Calothrix sp. HK-06]|nr:hypothetical protein NIES2101_27110 [Calothrix sp. HK-06]